jgi:hypothetical protein
MKEITMIWDEILICKEILDADIQSATAEIFSIDIQSIVVVSDISNENIDSNKPIIIENKKLGGDFPMRVAFYIKEKDVSILDIDRLQSILFLCRRLDCQILISDEDVNPYSMDLLDSSGSVTKVFLDVTKLDDEGEFTIKSFPHHG